jgi:pimeloyl-ACP methyl ester carboxylesterase
VLHPAYAFGGNLPAVMTEIGPEYFTQIAAFANAAQEGGIAYAMPRIITDLLQGDTESFEFFMTFGVDTPMPEPPVGAANTSPSLSVQPSFEAPLSVLLALAANANAGTDVGSQWAGTVVSDLNARLLAGEAQDVLVEALVRMALLPTNGTDPQALTDYATAFLSPEAAEAANALVGVMTDQDVRALMWTLQNIGFNLSVSRDNRAQSGFLQNIVNCADDMKWSSPEEAVALQEASPFPQIQALPFETTEAFFAVCSFIPNTTTEEVAQPLVSDVPTLILTGLLDIATPRSWGRQVAENLSNVQLVDFESLGHVTFGQTGDLCAGIVANSYFTDPTAAPDTTCVATYNLKPFVLPSAEIPR